MSSRIDHEPAAFDDYAESAGKRFDAVALESTLNTGAFICTGRVPDHDRTAAKVDGMPVARSAK
jgi:hypothetical protein